jgi:predicted Rossmann fold flavoprotein
MMISIVGAGPAGLLAAIHAAAGGAPTLVVEGNAAAGRKLLLTGGGRCNFTHAADPEQLARAFGLAGRFLRHSFYELSPDQIRGFFRARGLRDTVEPDGCVFPADRRAADICRILVDEVQKYGVRLRYRSRVQDLTAEGAGFRLELEDGPIRAARVILATGGLSWPQTGSQGDGYRFAAHLGHTITPPKPALVPLITRENWPSELAGISLPDVKIRTAGDGRRLVITGNMLFTQRGIGGPAPQDLSRLLADDLGAQPPRIEVRIDILPAWDEPQLDRRLQQEFQAHPRKNTASVLATLVPRQVARTLCHLARCDGDLQAGRLSAEKRRRLTALLKGLPLCVTGTEPLAQATVTHGGVRRDEIDPRTMESKLRPGLYFAGEVIDADGPCGGYNLQMCWSTGALAGRCAARTPGPALPGS